MANGRPAALDVRCLPTENSYTTGCLGYVKDRGLMDSRSISALSIISLNEVSVKLSQRDV